MGRRSSFFDCSEGEVGVVMVGAEVAVGDPTASSSLTQGGGDGVVCNVVVDSTGLVVCEPSDREDADESSSSLPVRLAWSSLSLAALSSIQLIPLVHVA